MRDACLRYRAHLKLHGEAKEIASNLAEGPRLTKTTKSGMISDQNELGHLRSADIFGNT